MGAACLREPERRMNRRFTQASKATPKNAAIAINFAPAMRLSCNSNLLRNTVVVLSAGFASALLAAPAAAGAGDTSPAQQLARFAADAGAATAPTRGQEFFTSTHGKQWSCASCHGEVPVGTGKHAGTGKSIVALAPAANAERFTDRAKAEKWFRRNCNDVLGRECTPAEKADVLAWLLTLKP